MIQNYTVTPEVRRSLTSLLGKNRAKDVISQMRAGCPDIKIPNSEDKRYDIAFRILRGSTVLGIIGCIGLGITTIVLVWTGIWMKTSHRIDNNLTDEIFMIFNVFIASLLTLILIITIMWAIIHLMDMLQDNRERKVRHVINSARSTETKIVS